MKASVNAIRNWEMHAGESFTDYFLDQYSYTKNGVNRWVNFLIGKGLNHIAWDIQEDTFTLRNGDVLECTDQQLKFEPHNTAEGQAEGCGGWDEDEYLKDVALWAEFINEHSDILAAYECFMDEDDDV